MREDGVEDEMNDISFQQGHVKPTGLDVEEVDNGNYFEQGI